MSLELRPNCECCDRDLSPASTDAFICTFECTYCWSCTSAKLGFICPNCGGELVRRPIRPAAKLVDNPASTQRIGRTTPCLPRIADARETRTATASPRIIVLHGPAAAGKYTIGHELAARTGLPLFHNHLTVDLLLAVFPFGNPEFVQLREFIWLDVMTKAIRAGTSLIFTFNPERTVSPGFPGELERRVAEYGGAVAFVEVQCTSVEIERRLGSEQRQQFRKLTSLPVYHSLKAAGAFDYPAIPSQCRVDSNQLSPTEAAEVIARTLGLAVPQTGSRD